MCAERTGEFPVAKLEQLEQPKLISLEERFERFCVRLYPEIKCKLRSQRKDDPNVRIQLSMEQDIYDQFESIGVPDERKARRIQNNKELEALLGKRWDVRVKNALGDFERVYKGSVKFWKFDRPPLDDFFCTGGKFFPYKKEQEHLFVFTFVRETGNCRQYHEQFETI